MDLEGSQVFFTDKAIKELEVKREEKRKKRKKRYEVDRLTFDCHKARIEDDRVKCSAGHPLSGSYDGCMTLVSVMEGKTASICRTCKDYEDGD